MKKTDNKPTKADKAKAKERFVASGVGMTVTFPNKKTTEKKGK